MKLIEHQYLNKKIKSVKITLLFTVGKNKLGKE
jgi:hypothetical protein